MVKTCVQCGKEFEITDSEVAFFEGKGLEIPKRCAGCRKENKRNRAKSRNNSKGGRQTGRRNSPDGHGYRTREASAPKNSETVKGPYESLSSRPAEEEKGFFAKIADAFRSIFGSGGK